MVIAETEIVKTSRGLTLECESADEVITKSLRENGTWEDWVARAIDEYLEPAWTFLDIGAHVGVFALQAAAKGNKVIAVEADPHYAEMLRRNAERNGLEVESHAVAVGAYEGDGYLKTDARFAANPGASYLTQLEGRPVKVTRLESILQGRRPEFVKLDIEGLEYDVLRDSPEVLDSAQVMVVEIGREMLDRYGCDISSVLSLLRSHGFGVTYMDGTSIDAHLLNIEKDHYANVLARRGYKEDPQIEAPRLATTATILLCAWRNMVIETVECMLDLQSKGWGWSIARGDALISRSRSRIVSNWYRHTEEDVFLMIDDDVVFEQRAAECVVELAREKKSIAIAAYPVKDGGHLACRRFPGQEITFGPDSPPVEVIYPATGFMAVHRDVITAMVNAKTPEGTPHFPLCDANGLAPMWAFFDCFSLTYENGQSEYLSEDYAFGEVARQLGFKVWLDPSITLFHMGTFPYNVHNMKNVVRIEGDPE